MNAEIQTQLEYNRKLEEKIDLAVSCAIFLPIILAVAWLIWDSYNTQVSMPDAFVRLVIVLVIGRFGIYCGNWMLPRLTARIAPSYLIDSTEPEVVKLYGSIRGDGADNAVEMLLAARPGLQMYRGDANKDFGCTLAAVTATQEFLQAKAEMKKFGVSIR
ncbi:hypothetical protein ACS8E9_18665 [Pseudomonas neustonica]|uniref:hypothetical protein n=1 Tax=Pseudomonas neustonica TaxID=2487346 RepID=UPI003F46B447